MCDIKTISDSERKLGRTTNTNIAKNIVPNAVNISAIAPTISADLAALQARWTALALQDDDDDDSPKTSRESVTKSLSVFENAYNVKQAKTRALASLPFTDAEQREHDAELDAYLLGLGKDTAALARLDENRSSLTAGEKQMLDEIQQASEEKLDDDSMSSRSKLDEADSWWDQARARAIKRKQEKDQEEQDEYKLSQGHGATATTLNTPAALKLDETWRASHDTATRQRPVMATEVKNSNVPLFQSPESKRILQKVCVAKTMSTDNSNASELMEYGTIKQRNLNSALSKKAIRTLLKLDTNAIDDQDKETSVATIPAAVARAKRSEKSDSTSLKNLIVGHNQGVVAAQLKEKLRLKREIKSLNHKLLTEMVGSIDDDGDRDPKSPLALRSIKDAKNKTNEKSQEKVKEKSAEKSQKQQQGKRFQTRIGDDSVAFRTPMNVRKRRGRPDKIDQRQTYFYAIQKRLLMPDLLGYITSSYKDVHENHTRMIWNLECAIRNLQKASTRDSTAAKERVDYLEGYKAKYLAQGTFYKKLQAYYQGHWIKMKMNFQKVRMRMSMGSIPNGTRNETLEVPDKTCLLGCHLYVGNEQVGPPTVDTHQLVTDAFMQQMYDAFRVENVSFDPTTLVANASSGTNNYFTYNPYERLFFHPFVAIYIGSGGTSELGIGVSMDMRNMTRRYFGNSIPTKEAIDAILDNACGRPLVHLNSGSGYWAYVCRQAFVIRRQRFKDLVEQSRADIQKTRAERSSNIQQAIEKLKGINTTYSLALIEQITKQAQKVDAKNGDLYVGVDADGVGQEDDNDDDSDVPTNITVNELIKSEGSDHEDGKIVGTWYPTMHLGTMLSFCESPKAKNTVLVFNWPKVEAASQVLKSVLASKADTIIYIGPAQDPDPNVYMEYLDVAHMIIENVFPWDNEPDLVKRKKLRQRYREDVESINKQSWICKTTLPLHQWPGLVNVGDCLYVLTREGVPFVVP